jgi:small subunit ribosomal protein S20
LANTQSALKEIRKSLRRRTRNRLSRSKARTFAKRAVSAVEAGEANAESEIRAAMRELDKAAAKGILHKNNAARRKSRLMKKLNAQSSET